MSPKEVHLDLLVMRELKNKFIAVPLKTGIKSSEWVNKFARHCHTDLVALILS